MFVTSKWQGSGMYRWLFYIGAAILFVLALVVRAELYQVQTTDYTFFVSQWYDFIQSHGGFAALKENFSNYNVPYLYLVAICTYLPIPKLIAIKSLSVVFDGLLGLFVYLIIRLKYQRSYAAIGGALAIAWAPTIFINSAAWGQCDAIYTAFCLGSLYFLLKDRPLWACLFFGLAISFKLQAIFFLPVLLVLLLRRKLALKYLVLVPVVFVLLLVPAFVAGRDAPSLLSIYVGQAATGGVGGQFNRTFNRGTPGQFDGSGIPGQFNGGAPRQFDGSGIPGQYGDRRPGSFNGRGRFNGGGQFYGGGMNGSSGLTANAPSFYQWLSTDAPAYWKWIGIGLAAAFVAAIGLLVWRSKQQITSEILIKVALVFAIAIPFLLPEMHERYFYLADVLSIIAAFYFPRLFYVAISMQICSLLSYAPYFLRTEIIPLSFVSLGILILAAITTADLVLALYPGLRSNDREPVAIYSDEGPALYTSQ